MDKFQVDRIILDRSVWTVYFKSTVERSKEIFFDTFLVEKLGMEDHLKQTVFKGKGKEKVLYFEEGSPVPFIKYELRLRQTRSLNVYFNFNRYILAKNNFVHDIRCPIIHDDNFLPLDAKIGIDDYLEVFDYMRSRISEFYLKWYYQFWPEDQAVLLHEEPVVKCTTLEVAREMYPLDVQTIRNDLATKGKHFKSYNNNTKTMYFGDAPVGTSQMNIDNAVMNADLDCWNWKNKNEASRQAKLYQKSISLVRFEITLYNDQIDFGSENPGEDVKFQLQNFAEEIGICFVPDRLDYSEMVEYLALMLKLDKGLCEYLLVEGTYWLSNKKNHVLTQKLKRRGLVKKDSRGIWIVNPAFLKMFEQYVRTKKQEKYFVPKLL